MDILVIAAHPDDAELGMGGTIVKLLAEGKQVGILDLTDGEPTPHGSPEIRAAETQAASAALGISWRENLRLPNRSLLADLPSREALANVIRKVRPRWLFAPYWEDAHPDHVAASRLVEDARFWAKLTKSHLQHQPHHPERVFHYFSIHLRLAIKPDFIVDISEQWPQKRMALEAFDSQLVQGRQQQTPTLMEKIRDQAAYFGQLIGAEYGEPFASREPIGLHSISSLK